MTQTLGRVSTGSLGVALQNTGQVRKSIPYFQKAFESAKENKSRQGEGAWLSNLGSSYLFLGDIRKSIECYAHALVIAKEIGNRNDEGSHLGNLGNAYAVLGDVNKAIDFYNQSLAVEREIGNKFIEGIHLGNLSNCLTDLGKYTTAIANAVDGINIGIQISSVNLGNFNNYYLAYAHLFAGDLQAAQSAIETAEGYDEPQNNHNASALHGIIALRQGDEVAARGAFVRAIGQADEILSKTAEYYEALDAKGIALSGLVVSSEWEVDGERQKALDEAVETFRKARKIAPHAGVVKSVLRLFDELVKCDGAGILKDVRNAAEGK